MTDHFPGATELFKAHPEAWGLIGNGWGHQRASAGRSYALKVAGADTGHLDAVAISRTQPGEKPEWEPV